MTLSNRKCHFLYKKNLGALHYKVTPNNFICSLQPRTFSLRHFFFYIINTLRIINNNAIIILSNGLSAIKEIFSQQKYTTKKNASIKNGINICKPSPKKTKNIKRDTKTPKDINIADILNDFINSFFKSYHLVYEFFCFFFYKVIYKKFIMRNIRCSYI